MTQKEKKLSADLLLVLQGNTAVLLFQTLHYHWNLVGPEFHDYHLLFDKQYRVLFEDLDLFAERVRALESFALGSMKDLIKSAKLSEDTGKIPQPKQMVVKLLQQYENHIEQIREAIVYLEEKEIHDSGTKKMLEDLIEKYEKTAWMLRALSGK